MSIKVYKYCEEKSENMSDARFRFYPGLDYNKIIEIRELSGESDFYTGRQSRESVDGGKSFGPWQDAYAETYRKIGETEDEEWWVNEKTKVYDPKSGYYVTCAMQRYCVDGHIAAYDSLWGKGERHFFDHCYLCLKKPDGDIGKKILVNFEGGRDMDPNDPRNPDFLKKNVCYFGNISIANNGDLIFPVAADVKVCCQMLGLDVNDVFPSCPNLMFGMVLVRAAWNGESYDLSYSRPMVISDQLSSRGVCEPCAAQLKSGKIIVIFRASNVISEEWNTRINPYALPCKWYAYSEDDGKTFSPAMPLTFTTREVVYSSATMPYLFRSSKTDKLYWIGNITPPEKTHGNFPRYPLYICEVDDEHGALKKETLTVVDTISEGETEFLQLSNLDLFENKITGRLEIRLCKLGRVSGDVADKGADSWCYEIEFD